MRWSVKKTRYLSVLLGGICAAGAFVVFSRREAAADAAGAPALPPVVHRLTGEVLHPLPPEELAALRKKREAARLRRIWAETPGGRVEFLLGLRDESVRQHVEQAFPQLTILQSEGRLVRCAAPREVAESFLTVLPEGVEWICDAPEAVLLNAVAGGAWFLGLSEPLRKKAYAPTLDGRGEAVAVIDTGISSGSISSLNPDLKPAVYGMVVEPSISGAGNLIPLDGHGHGHGTHVAGSVVSLGENYPGTAGSAPGAHLLVQKCAVGGTLYIASNDVPHFERSYAAGARIISCSWMHSLSTTADNYDYTKSLSREIDEFVWNHPDVTICFAAGNSGADKNLDGVIDAKSVYSYEAYAKNVIVVGAQENYRDDQAYQEIAYSTAASPIRNDRMAKPYQDGIHGMAAFSSRGPLADGRIAPMLTAPGSRILSTLVSGGSDASGYMDGTSMATPLVAGSAAVLRQYLRECHGLESPTAAAVRAGLILCAETLAPGQYGTGDFREIPETSPNSVEGWGALRLGKHLTGSATLGFEDRISLKTGESESFSVTIPEASAGKEFVAVLSWIDAPKKSGSYDRTLANDYDLTVTDPDGKVHSVGDAVNPIERIRIPAAQAGTYTVTVTGQLIEQEGTGNLAAVAWRATTAAGPVSLPAADPVSEETVTLTVHGPLNARPYLDFPLYPAPGVHTFPKGKTIRVLAGAKLNPSKFSSFESLSGWTLRRKDGSLQQGHLLQGKSSADFELTLDQDMTLRWYTLFPGYRFLLR